MSYSVVTEGEDIMRISAESLRTRSHPVTLFGKIVQFPLVRMVIVALFLAPYLIFHNMFLVELYPDHEPARSMCVDIDKIMTAIIFFLIYKLYLHWVEKRNSPEISTKKCLPEFGSGVLISLSIVSSFVLILRLSGWYKVMSIGAPEILVEALFTFTFGAFLQVFIFRIVILRILEEWLGKWPALTITASMFGLIHFFNANSTIRTSIALALSDVMLIAAFYYTHRIWLVWGIHAGWNFFQDGLFGMPNSGLDQFPSWITPHLSGPLWFTGGAFGIEASAIIVLANTLIGVYLLRLAVKPSRSLLETSTYSEQ